MRARKPVVLCILDGWGLSDSAEGNAPKLAATPNLDALLAEAPNARLVTHGRDVGLPDGQMGNSEVGHMNIGAGRVVSMDLGRIDLAIADGSFASNPRILEFAESLRGSGGTAHLLGLVSDGGVHSHLEHVRAAAQAICASGVPVVLHAFSDGRDVPPSSAPDQFRRLLGDIPDRASVGTVSGRYFAMDRDRRWDRVQLAFDAIMHGEGRHADDALSAIADAHARGETDEFVHPTVIGDYAGMKDGDGAFCLNFRADRVREIMAAIAQPDFNEFGEFGGVDKAGETADATNAGDSGRSGARRRAALAACLGMTGYSDEHDRFMSAAYPKEAITNTLGAWVAGRGLRQFRIAETEKYPHVTFFLNGGKEEPERGEDRLMPPSPKVATYDLAPEMSASAVTDGVVEAIHDGYDLVVANYANPDMVGHTGVLEAAVSACAAVDACLGRALAALRDAGGAMLVLADHGNCETMIDPETGGPHTAHTLNPVPVALAGYLEDLEDPEDLEGGRIELRDGRLADVAPTILELMGLDAPPEMTGRSLIARAPR